MRIDIQCLVGGTICDLNDFKLCVNSYNYETCAWTPNNGFGKPLLRNQCHYNHYFLHKCLKPEWFSLLVVTSILNYGSYQKHLIKFIIPHLDLELT